MWTRVAVKDYAKNFLRYHYWKAFLVCLIVALLTSSGNNSSRSGNKRDTINLDHMNKNSIVRMLDDVEEMIPTRFARSTYRIATSILMVPFKILGGGIILLFGLVFIFIRVTLGYALEVGEARFFLRGFEGDVAIGKIATVFAREEYFSVIKTQFLKNLYNFLWYFALVVPGIIKSYEYRFVPYILADNPNLPTDQVINRSMLLTEGHKMDMFFMDLSFIGWYLLGSLFAGFGVYFVNPYKSASFARLYDILSQ